MTNSSPELKIVRYGHPALRRRSAPVGRITDEVKDLVAHMLPVMRRAVGVGLAANQVGVTRRVAVIEIEGKVTPLIDPEIVSRRGSEISDEGCLSLPRLFGQVERPAEVVVRARDLSGKWVKIRGEGLLARALCHEIDHLDGKLFIDRVDDTTLYWAIRTQGAEESVIQPTSREEALQVFLNAHRAEGE
jgi:peptide deformylase